MGAKESFMHTKPVDELFLVQLRMQKRQEVFAGGFDTRPHELLIINDLDQLMQDADDIRMAPLLSLLTDPDPRVHIIATASPGGIAAKAVQEKTLRFDWNLFGATEDLPLLPHQFGFIGGEGEPDVHMVWVPKI
jgi:hypothetical protein